MVVVTAWSTQRARIPWQAASAENPLPLGRNLYHDERNRAYPWQRTAAGLTTQLWPRQIPILDQGNVGSCTGNEQVGALGTGPLFDALPAGHIPLDEPLALRIYSGAETIDGDGPYPPNDNGSSGPSAAQVAKNMGWISGYLHCFSLADVLDALEAGPVGIGSNWYDSMDRPDSSGLVAVSPGAQIRGGHEYLCRGKDVDKKILFLDNSWGTGFGVDGSFCYSYATLERLLAEQGDATVSLPLTAPAPVPVPVPPVPVPGHNTDDVAFATLLHPWVQLHHIGGNAKVAKAAQTWMTDKGL
jgi:hypothetical protein